MKAPFFSRVTALFLLTLSGVAFAQSSPVMNAVYVVPASGASSQDTSYVVTDFSISSGSEPRSFSFSLPADLVGPGSTPVLMKQTSATNGSSWELTGDLASATCTMADTSIGCKMSFSPQYKKLLGLNEAAVRNYLVKTYGSDESVLSQKLDAAVRFMNDPEGVIAF